MQRRSLGLLVGTILVLVAAAYLWQRERRPPGGTKDTPSDQPSAALDRPKQPPLPADPTDSPATTNISMEDIQAWARVLDAAEGASPLSQDTGDGAEPAPDTDLVDSPLWISLRERGIPEGSIGKAMKLMMKFGADPSDTAEDAFELLRESNADGFVPPGTVVIQDDEMEGKSIEEIRAMLRKRAKASREAEAGGESP